MSEEVRVEAWGRVFVLSLGAVLGVNARYWLGVWINKWASPQFPWATFVINVTGSFAFGFFVTVLARWLPHPNARLLVLTGFLGGYTTFSSFAYESVTLWERGEKGLAVANMAGSVAAGFAAVALGIGSAKLLEGKALAPAPRERRKARSLGYGPSPHHPHGEGAIPDILGADRIDQIASEGWRGGDEEGVEESEAT